MHKKVIILFLSLFFLFVFIFFTTAQITSNPIPSQLVNRGTNFETTCIENHCNTTVYSYDNYFKRNNQWEEIDEDWFSCEEGFCTNDYHFKAVAGSSGLVSLQRGNEQLTQQITSFAGIN